MIVWPAIVAKLGHTISLIMRAVWNSAKLVGRLARGKGLQAAGRAVGKAMMHSQKLQSATANVLRAKLKYLPKGWDNFQQSALSKTLQAAFKTGRFGIP